MKHKANYIILVEKLVARIQGTGSSKGRNCLFEGGELAVRRLRTASTL